VILNDALEGAKASHGDGLNPLVGAANALLHMVVPLRLMVAPPDMEQLRHRLIQAIQLFEAQACANQVNLEKVAAARYALCTLMDETISSTAWGEGVWNSRSLLVTFHNQAWGGEKFFLILQRLCQDARKNFDVLELMYLCLALGLEGRYRVMDRGVEQLTALRARLLQLIQQQRGALERDLSLCWRGTEAPQQSALRLVPLWVLAAVVAALLLTLQMTYSWLLNRDSDPIYSQLSMVQITLPSNVVRPDDFSYGEKPALEGVSKFLAPEVAAGLIGVRETAGRSIITLSGDGVFASGSADVASAFEPLLARIGGALATVPGEVLVVGYTDNIRPAMMARLSSNFDLSNARAKNVARLLASLAGPSSRYLSEGRGETEPLFPNDTASNRARNRRVEITLLAPTKMQ
jgi:type VI secretion system protein ImpK